MCVYMWQCEPSHGFHSSLCCSRRHYICRAKLCICSRDSKETSPYRNIPNTKQQGKVDKVLIWLACFSNSTLLSFNEPLSKFQCHICSPQEHNVNDGSKCIRGESFSGWDEVTSSIIDNDVRQTQAFHTLRCSIFHCSWISHISRKCQYLTMSTTWSARRNEQAVNN